MLKTMCTNHLIPFHQEFAACIFQSSTPGFWIVWVQKNKGCILFAVPASMHQRQFSMQGFHLIYFEILQESQNQRFFYNPLSKRIFPLQWFLCFSLSVLFLFYLISLHLLY